MSDAELAGYLELAMRTLENARAGAQICPYDLCYAIQALAVALLRLKQTETP